MVNYLYDGLGNVVGLVNASGTRVNNYSYDPYGNSTAKTEQIPNPFQYAGGYLDSATGLYHFGARYYDPTTGRWTQLDPSGQDAGYVYTGDDPVNAADPTGHGSITLSPTDLTLGSIAIGAILGAVAIIVGASGIATAVGVAIGLADIGIVSTLNTAAALGCHITIHYSTDIIGIPNHLKGISTRCTKLNQV